MQKIKLCAAILLCAVFFASGCKPPRVTTHILADESLKQTALLEQILAELRK